MPRHRLYRHRPHLVQGLGAQIAEQAPMEGPNAGPWPGLVTYRYSGPALWMRGQVQFLPLVIVAQGHHQVTIDGMTRVQGPLQCLVLRGDEQVDVEVLEASIRRPYLSVVLEIDPGLVRRVASDILAWRTTGGRTDIELGGAERACAYELLAVVIRAGRRIKCGMDRHLLAPLYQREMVYWLLQSEHGPQVRALASAESATVGVSAVIAYARAHLAEPLSVTKMAKLANLSTSAFAHQFRDATGRPPHQFLRDMRLSYARELLADTDLPVARISREVGYASPSHFISAFHTRYGVTPLAYSNIYA